MKNEISNLYVGLDPSLADLARDEVRPMLAGERVEFEDFLDLNSPGDLNLPADLSRPLRLTGAPYGRKVWEIEAKHRKFWRLIPERRTFWRRTSTHL